jgi:serine/threonine-protein kinase RsbW
MAAAVVAELAAGLGAQQVTLALTDPSSGQLEVIGRHGPQPVAASDALTQIMRAGHPRFWSAGETAGVTPPPAGAADGSAAALALLPLAARGAPVGVVSLGFAEPRLFDAQERAFMETCAGQCSQALERARLYENERTVAHTLQKSLLAGAPPQDPRFSVATCYLPAIEDHDVGGDWYDTFRTGEETIGVVVGDVVGRGIEAASAMGQLRSATRALAGAQLGPAGVLERLDGFVEHLPRGRVATLVCAEIDLRTGATRYACAGHPPPLLLQPGEPTATLWEGRGAPLGTGLDAPRVAEGHVDLQPGARLLLYTDGVVERRRGLIDAGLSRLGAEVEKRRTTPMDDLLGELVDVLVGEDEPRDDVCLQCLEYRGPGPIAA